MSIEDANYYNDPRVRNAGRNKVPTTYDDDGNEVELPWHWGVCPTCDGKGTHVNPSIDAGGITGSDMADDPEFFEDYMGGRYDVTCSQCGGRTTVPTPDHDRMTPEQREALESQQDADAAYDAERAAEIRMGA
jgi:hypothetical protein